VVSSLSTICLFARLGIRLSPPLCFPPAPRSPTRFARYKRTPTDVPGCEDLFLETLLVDLGHASFQRRSAIAFSPSIHLGRCGALRSRCRIPRGETFAPAIPPLAKSSTRSETSYFSSFPRLLSSFITLLQFVLVALLPFALPPLSS